MAWDTGAGSSTRSGRDQFVAPKSGALGWVDTFAIPARAATMSRLQVDQLQYEAGNRRQVAASDGQLHGVERRRQADGRKAQGPTPKASPGCHRQHRWYPAVPRASRIEGKCRPPEGRHRSPRRRRGRNLPRHSATVSRKCPDAIPPVLLPPALPREVPHSIHPRPISTSSASPSASAAMSRWTTCSFSVAPGSSSRSSVRQAAARPRSCG